MNNEIDVIIDDTRVLGKTSQDEVAAAADSVGEQEQRDSPLVFSAGAQWTSSDGRMFVPAATSVNTLPPEFYSAEHMNSVGYFAKKIPLKTQKIIKLPDGVSDIIIDEIEKFWSKEGTYKDYGITYKRGIFMYGPPGSGKTSTIMLAVQSVIEKGGIVISFSSADNLINLYRIIRLIQPDVPIMILFEDIESLIECNRESDILNIIDGVERVYKTLFLATTNYPEQLGERIINRPSRFDKRYFIGLPDAKVRAFFIKHLFDQAELLITQKDLIKWVTDTEGMTISHVQEVFTSCAILESNFEEVIKTVRAMISEKPNSVNDYPTASFGLAPVNAKDRKKVEEVEEVVKSLYTIKEDKVEQACDDNINQFLSDADADC